MVSTAGAIVIAVVVILLAAAVGWVAFTQLRARRLGLPPPTLSSYIPFRKPSAAPYGPPRPAAGGIVGWVNDQVRKFKNRNSRSAAGSYEGSSLHPGASGGARPGAGPLDPDEAWDARVGHEADGYGGYYEEQELSGRVTDTAYPGTYGRVGDEEEQRGRTARGYSGGEEMGPVASRNPFDDEAATSLRGLSPRPMDRGARRSESSEGSPQGRRSVFRENV